MTEAVVAAFIGVPLCIAVLLAQAALWQRKEYRWDRIVSHWREPAGTQEVIHWLLLALVVDVGWLSLWSGWIESAMIAGWLALGGSASLIGYTALRRGFSRPVTTAKAVLVVLCCAAVLAAYVLLWHRPLTAPVLQWASLLLVTPAVMAIVVPVINVPVALRKRQIINTATALRQHQKRLVPVGITGSYGKTSVKYFLAQILTHAKVSHAVTREHRNAEVPVAQDMLEQLPKKPDVYVAEMGAYRVGEIAALVRLVRPRIGVVTAIGNQHVSLFGSRAALARAKWELVAGLPKAGVAVLNRDDATVVEQAKKTRQRVIWYSVQQSADVYASGTSVHPRSLRTTIHLGAAAKPVSIPLAGVQQLPNVIAAAAAALALDVPTDAIFDALTQLQPVPQTMALRQGYRGATVIDDSYSANEPGVMAALQHLKRFPEARRLIVMVPLIELGEEATVVHQRLGTALAASGATVLLYGTAQREALLDGAGSSAARRFFFFSDPKALTQEVRRRLRRDCVVLLEGRVPAVVRKAALS